MNYYLNAFNMNDDIATSDDIAISSSMEVFDPQNTVIFKCFVINILIIVIIISLI